jgi:hypothetical protein
MRLRRQLSLAGLLFLVVFVVAMGGAAPRYNRVVYGAMPTDAVVRSALVAGCSQAVC